MKGIEKKLNPDYRVVETNLTVNGEHLKASVWINFEADGMHSKFTLEKLGTLIYERKIDKANNGIEFFLEMYKTIMIEKNDIVIKGHKDVKYLPLKIPISEISMG